MLNIFAEYCSIKTPNIAQSLTNGEKIAIITAKISMAVHYEYNYRQKCL